VKRVLEAVAAADALGGLAATLWWVAGRPGAGELLYALQSAALLVALLALAAAAALAAPIAAAQRRPPWQHGRRQGSG
jgi:ABC-type transport system involved in cytochrome bd biosynthesis fused ATPase/permease subunit